MIPWLYAVDPQGRVSRFPLSSTATLVGRASSGDGPGKINVAGDPALSRQHFWVQHQDAGLEVRLHASAAHNPLYFQGERCTQLRVQPGQHFLAGASEFQLVRQRLEQAPAPEHAMTLAHGARQELRARRALECLDAMTHLLPMLRHQHDSLQLWRATLELLESLFPTALQLVALEVDRRALESGQGQPYKLLRAIENDTDLPLPSAQLLAAAFASGQTMTYGWKETVSYATPLVVADKEAYSLVVSCPHSPGQEVPEPVLLDLIGETLGHHLEALRAQRLWGQVGQFFSPDLRARLASQGWDAIMAPARREVTVLFFDLRGFSKATEAAAEDAAARLLAHHQKLTEVMTEVTDCVFAEDGIVVDYQGDAVMACWGALGDTEDHPLRACRAALAIIERVYRLDLPFAGGPAGRMRCGMGVGSGQVVAGQVGARHQVKFGVMGHVINLSSRLEGLTKYVGVPILLNSDVHRAVAAQLPCRRVGRARPAGLRDSVEIFELVVPRQWGGSGLGAEQVVDYERAEQHFRERDLDRALELLRALEDPVSGFLVAQIERYRGAPPPLEWDGAIEFTAK